MRTSRRRIVAIVCAATAATVVAAVGLATTASARPAPSVPAAAPAGVAPAMFTALQRDLHLTAAQARDRLAADDRASRVQAVLRTTFGKRYGGTWIADDGTLTAGVVDGAQATAVRALGARPVRVARSQAQLDAVVDRLDRAGDPPAGVTGWYADLAGNTVVLQTLPGGVAAARAFAARAGVASAVRVRTTTERPAPYLDVIGGNAYYINGNTRCSIGFSVPGGFISAGHCGRPGDRTAQPSGTFRASTFPGHDYSWVQVDAGNTPRGLVNNYTGGTVAVTGSAEAAVGSTVCRSGSTSGWHCGTILQKNATVTYAEGTVYGLTRTNACAEPGDSGGSWVTGDQAQGVTSGGSGNCTTGGTTYFQPVNPILAAYGLTLVTSGGGGPSPTPTATSQPPGGSTTWAPYTSYPAGAQVTYDGVEYVCIQGHTSLPGWEPPIVPALWQPI